MNWSSIENIEITYRLLNIRGFGPVKANRLLWSIYSSVNSSEQYERRVSDTLSPAEAEMFTSKSGIFTPDGDISFISVLDERYYPERLRNILKQNNLEGVLPIG